MSAVGGSSLDRIHLIGAIVPSLIAAALDVFGFVNQSKAQELTVNVKGSNDDLSGARAERDVLAERVAGLEVERDGAGEETTEETAVTSIVLDPVDSLAAENCTNFRSGGGHWNAEPMAFADEEHLHLVGALYHRCDDRRRPSTSPGRPDSTTMRPMPPWPSRSSPRPCPNRRNRCSPRPRSAVSSQRSTSTSAGGRGPVPDRGDRPRGR